MEVSDKSTWLSERTKGIGGSDASVVLGINPWKSRLELWTEKTTGKTIEKDNIILRLGKRLEPFIIEEYIESTKRDVEAGTYALENIRSKDYDFMQANLDGRISNVNGRDGKGILECKIKGAFVKWDDDIPSYYYSQVQHYMAVTGYQWASMAILNFSSGQLEWKDIERDEEFIQKLIEEEKNFWKLVTDKIPPSPDGSKACENFLRQKYCEGDKNKIIDLQNNSDATKYSTQLRQVKNEIGNLKIQETECKNVLMGYMQDAEIGIGNGYKITWKRPKDKIVFDVDKFKEENMNLYKNYILKEEQSRRFTIKFKEENNEGV